MTTLGAAIVLALRGASGGLTSAELARRIEILGVDATPRGVANACCWLRGQGWVTDGSIAERIGSGIAHTPASSPITWRYLREQTEAPLNRVFHGEEVEPLA